MKLIFMESPLMDWKKVLENETTLDPGDWTEIEVLGQKMVTEMVDYLQYIDQEPVWRKPTDDLKLYLKGKLSEEGGDLEKIYADFKQYILPYPAGNINPRFWSWVQGTGTFTGALADMLASTLNSNMAIGDHAAMYVEQQVIEWCKELMGFQDESSSGILLSGGSMANITALTIARNAIDPSIRKAGVQSWPKKLLFYASSETHSCQEKAAEIIGIGSQGMRKVAVNDRYEMDIHALRQMIEQDLSAGSQPFCVVANVGTVNTGAIDPLAEIEQICKEFNLWLHIDGAFGALTKLLPEYNEKLEVLSKADSLAFDLHKWMYLPYEVGCLLVKSKKYHRDAFASQPSYLAMHERGLSAGPDPIGNYGMELSRGFKALKVWFCLQEHGRKKYEDMIRQNIAQCLYLADRITHENELELMAPVPMNIVCFRYRAADMDQNQLNILNKEILMQLHEQAIATPSYTLLNGSYVIRVAHVNHRSKKKDFDALIAGVLDIGRRLRR